MKKYLSLTFLFVCLAEFVTTPCVAQIKYLSEVKGEEIATARDVYKEKLNHLEKARKSLAVKYASANQTEKKQLILEARKVLTNMLVGEVFTAWYRTRWDFNGVTQTPGQGEIACGYFVTTTLRDIGIKLNRVKWAQQASVKMIRKFCPQESIKVIYNKPIKESSDYLKAQGEGVYLVGLDRHVGYVIVEKSRDTDELKMAFVHADYYDRARGVTSEVIEGNNPLNDSKYRMVGKLFSEAHVIAWLQEKHYANP